MKYQQPIRLLQQDEEQVRHNLENVVKMKKRDMPDTRYAKKKKKLKIKKKPVHFNCKFSKLVLDYEHHFQLILPSLTASSGFCYSSTEVKKNIARWKLWWRHGEDVIY